jgi:hypothetical protein
MLKLAVFAPKSPDFITLWTLYDFMDKFIEFQLSLKDGWCIAMMGNGMQPSLLLISFFFIFFT